MAWPLRFAPMVRVAAVASWVLLSATVGLAPQVEGISSSPLLSQGSEPGPAPVPMAGSTPASVVAHHAGPVPEVSYTTSGPCYVGRCVAATVPVGKGPDSVVYDGAKGEVFVANENSNDVSVVQDSNSTLVDTIPVGHLPTGMAYDAGRGEIFVANSGSPDVSVISDATNRVVASIPLNGNGSKEMAYDRARNEIFVTNDDSNT